MPAIQGSMLGQTAKNLLRSKNIKLPLNYKGLPDQAPFDQSDQNYPSPEWATWLFKPSSTLKYHVNTAKMISKGFDEFITNVCDGIGKAFAQWQSGAMFTNVIINASFGIAVPGSMVAPPAMTGPMIFSQINVAGKQPSFIRHAMSVANAIGTAFQAWQTGYFATLTFPGGVLCSVSMVPSPNIPIPVAAGTSIGDPMMTKGSLYGLMLGNHGMPGNHTQAVYDAIAGAFSMLFTQWKATTTISNIMGAGGVAPPPPAPPGPVALALGNGGKLI